MASKLIDTTSLYNIIADTMPTEGRDFVIDAQTRGNETLLKITPLTAVGRSFVPLLLEKLAKPMRDKGMAVDVGGKEAQEVATVNSIRAQAEREGTAAMEAKLDAANKDAAAKAAALKEASGTANERAAHTALIKTQTEARRLAGVISRLPETRKEIDAAALEMARADEANGASWAMDHDAALTTLFDRQAAANAMRYREEASRRMAEWEYDAADLKRAAASVVKPYAVCNKKEV